MLSMSKNHLTFKATSLSNHTEEKESVKTVPEHTQPQIKTMKPK